jgi:hypothetical protein
VLTAQSAKRGREGAVQARSIRAISVCKRASACAWLAAPTRMPMRTPR